MVSRGNHLTISVQIVPNFLRHVKVDHNEHLLHFGAITGEAASLRLLLLLQLLLPLRLQAIARQCAACSHCIVWSVSLPFSFPVSPPLPLRLNVEPSPSAGFFSRSRGCSPDSAPSFGAHAGSAINPDPPSHVSVRHIVVLAFLLSSSSLFFPVLPMHFYIFLLLLSRLLRSPFFFALFSGCPFLTLVFLFCLLPPSSSVFSLSLLSSSVSCSSSPLPYACSLPRGCSSAPLSWHSSFSCSLLLFSSFLQPFHCSSFACHLYSFHLFCALSLVLILLLLLSSRSAMAWAYEPRASMLGCTRTR